MNKTMSKAASERYAIELIYNAPDLNKGETIESVEVSVSPEGLTVGDPEKNGNKVSAMISGGTVGKSYIVLFKVTTSAGHIYNNPDRDAVEVKIK